MRYQKLSLLRAPPYSWGLYTAKYRYWSGLLLLVCILLSLISFDLNFSLDPHVDLMSTVFIVGGLILLKGATAKRVYKNWSLDVMETAIYLLQLSCFFSSHSVQCSLGEACSFCLLCAYFKLIQKTTGGVFPCNCCIYIEADYGHQVLWREPGCFNLHACHDHFLRLIGGHGLSSLVLHLASEMLF